VTDPKPIHQALADVMEDVRVVHKGERNSQQGYIFRGIDAVINAVGPVLRKHGVVPMPMLEAATYRDVQTNTGKPSREVTVKVRYRFYGPAGDFLDAIVPGESMDFGDKGTAKAMSVAMRIALLQALALPTDDPDPDTQSYERAPVPVERVTQDPSEADEARERVRIYCKATELDMKLIPPDFTKVTGEDIKSASADVVDGYLTQLKAKGLRA
jgi:hypothetical protein